jgi:hypothetical protein
MQRFFAHSLHMNQGSETSIHAGDIECFRFVNASKCQLVAITNEFGGSVLASPSQTARPLVRILFEEVSPPDEANYVGRTNAVAGDFLYCCEGGFWAAVPLNFLLDPQQDFVMRVSPGYDIVRLLGYLLEPLAKVRALLVGHCFVHSSTIEYEGKAILLSAWGNTGKTNLLLHFERVGAGMLADDWSILLSDGRIAGYPRPVNLMNYNLDAFPYLLKYLSWKQRILYRVDRYFRRGRPWFTARGGIFLRLADGVERVLETLSNCRIPVGNFENSNRDSLIAAAVIEVHKLRRGAAPRVQDIPVQDAARMATVCFGFENGRLMQRLAEFAYLNPSYDGLPCKILDLYRHTLEINLTKAVGTTIPSLGMPARPNPEELLETAAMVQSLATR